jgi:hypothetical protein
MSSTSLRTHCARAATLLCLSLFGSAPVAAQLRPVAAPQLVPVVIALKPELSLPLVPPLQLTPPALLAPTPAIPEGLAAHQPWLHYWHDAQVPAEWRDATDDELRLRLETGNLELGDWAVSTGLRLTPEHERECYAGYRGCRGADWESSVILKYEAGNVGPLQQAGPMLELTGKPPTSGVRGRGLFNVGIAGAF